MFKQAVFDITEKGRRELCLPPDNVSWENTSGGNISGDARLILPLFGNGLTFAKVVAKLPSGARAGCEAVVNKLIEKGYIARHVAMRRVGILIHPKQARRLATPAGDAISNLDFTGSNLAVTAVPQEPIEMKPDDEVRPDDQRDAACELAETRAHAGDDAHVMAEQEVLKAGAEARVMEQEIESRSQKLASDKIEQFEQGMNNTIALMVEQALLQAEQEKLPGQLEMVEAARSSPMFGMLRELSFFKDFSAAELAEVLPIGVWHEREKNQAVVREGDAANSFFVMMSGSAGVLKRERLIYLLRRGGSFGELAYLQGEQATHNADVIAKSHIEFLEFSTGKLGQSSLEVRFQFATAFAYSQTRHLVRANKQIVNLLTDEYKRD